MTERMYQDSDEPYDQFIQGCEEGPFSDEELQAAIRMLMEWDDTVDDDRGVISDDHVKRAMMDTIADIRLQLDKMNEEIRQLEEQEAQKDEISECVAKWEGILGEIRSRI